MIGGMTSDDHVGYVLGQWRRELPALDRSAFGVVGRISRLAVLIGGALEPVFAAHGLTAGEFDVLAGLRRAGRPYRATPSELSRALIVTSGGMTRRLHALEDRGLIRRDAVPADGRSTAVVLTPAGKRVVDEVLREHVSNEERLVGALSSRERKELAAMLAQLALSLGDTPPPMLQQRPRASASRGRNRRTQQAASTPGGKARRSR